LRGFENTVRLAPNEYRWWIQLGRAYEQSDKMDRAEKALKYAIELAPNYTFPHWQLGNFYLRQGKEAEAFTELKKAAQNNVTYREQVFSIAWEYYDKNTAKVEELAGDSTESRAGLAKFYAAKERAEDSLRIWNTLSDDEKQTHEEIAKIIAQALYDKRFFRQSAQFVRQLGIESNAKAESIENAGFETEIRNEGKVDVKIDPNQKREGLKSLRVSFKGFSSTELYNVLQVVPVYPSIRYQLSFWVRTENLRTAGTPNLEIVNSNDDRLITVSKAFPNESNDWTQIQTEFTTPANAEGITIRLGRTYCGEACPILGTIWLDDFKLERLK
jgi:tetratricopeptide (TPR) repeat protein